MELFKLKKVPHLGECEAMRCTVPAVYSWDMRDPDPVGPDAQQTIRALREWNHEDVKLCDRHAVQAFAWAKKAEPTPTTTTTAIVVEAEGAKIVGWTEPSAVGLWLARVHEVVSTLPTLTQEGLDVATLVKEMTIESQADLVWVGECIQEAKAKLKSISVDEKEIALPVSTALARIRELCRPAKQAWADAEELLRAQLVAAKLREEERNRSVMVEARAEHINGGDATVALAKLTQTSDIEGVHLKLKWKAVVEDVSLLPDEYVVRVPNEKALKAYCTAAGEDEPAPIPGVRFERDVASRVQAAKV